MSALSAARPGAIASAHINIRSSEIKKGALPAFWNDPQAEPNDVLDAGTLAGDGRFHCRVEPIVGNRQRGPWLTVRFRTEPVQARQRLDVLFGHARAAPGGVRCEHVQVNEPPDRRWIFSL